jgi:hypothetical protein
VLGTRLARFYEKLVQAIWSVFHVFAVAEAIDREPNGFVFRAMRKTRSNFRIIHASFTCETHQSRHN